MRRLSKFGQRRQKSREALEEAKSGLAFYRQLLSNQVAKYNALIGQLSSPERALAQLMADEPGLTNEDYGDKLGVTVHTIKKHRDSIFRKWRINSKSELVAKLKCIPSQ